MRWCDTQAEALRFWSMSCFHHNPNESSVTRRTRQSTCETRRTKLTGQSWGGSPLTSAQGGNPCDGNIVIINEDSIPFTRFIDSRHLRKSASGKAPFLNPPSSFNELFWCDDLKRRTHNRFR